MYRVNVEHLDFCVIQPRISTEAFLLDLREFPLLRKIRELDSLAILEVHLDHIWIPC
jgi:hypothetical protein